MAAVIGILKALDRAGGVVFTVLAVVAACSALAVAVFTKVLASQPKQRRLGIGLGALAAVCILVAVGVMSFDRPSEPSTANPRFTSELVQSGPFTEQLPQGLQFDGLTDANISDPSSAQKLSATQIQISDTGSTGFEMFVWAHLEVYPSEELAALRWADKQQLLTALNETGLDTFGEGAACVAEPMSWTCIASRGLSYVEVTLAPNANATLSATMGTLEALLRYADEQALRAS